MCIRDRVIEDEEMIRKQLTKLLERNNYTVTGVATIEEAHACTPDSFDLILADIRLPGVPGTDILNVVHHAPVVIMTSHASVRSAVDAMRQGAVDYISKPFDHNELLLVIERAVQQKRLSVQNAAMRQDLRRVLPDVDFETRNPQLNELKSEIINLPQSASCVYLQGERGCGREILARLIHENSHRSGGPLVIADLPLHDPADLDYLLFGKPLNESAPSARSPGNVENGAVNEGTDSDTVALPEDRHHDQGLLRAAHAGTLVLRSMEEIPTDQQEKLCDWLEEGTSMTARLEHRLVDIRLVVLGARTLEQVTSSGTIGQRFVDLFKDWQMHVPPLRERPEDIEALAQHFLNQYSRRYRKAGIEFSKTSLHALQAYHYPGNVNELRSVIERAVLAVDTQTIEPAHMGLELLQDGVVNSPMDLSLDGYFRFFVTHHQAELSETELAQKLGISRKALWERRQKMNLPRQ